ncbi:MAG: ABC transporter ATP-binding protein [Acidimicrobiales bacterium]|jgi:branched-chain amino acid transport system ATP-binding protein|nr:ABC transporter ATP-binding protein [Acidimicrobiales bacterium]|tara:strand:+ start:1585 stop:2412 length:828 start_codon:yes stop_codon:yes gene_type:complete
MNQPAVATVAAEPILAVQNIEVVYNDVILVLRGVSLEVAEGEIVALLGANGAGKTTLLRAVTGLLEVHRGNITKGTVSFLGRRSNLDDTSRLVRNGLSQVMEGRRIFAELSVEENLRSGAYTVRSRQAVNEAHDRVVDLFPVLAERARSTAGYLSGGEQQMLAIGRALMASPKLLLLDEPSLGLAPLLVQQVRYIIRDINAQGTSVLLVEQNAAMALSIADRAYVMENGRIVRDGTGAELLADADIREFYLGVGETGHRSFRDVKTYRRRKRWSA